MSEWHLVRWSDLPPWREPPKAAAGDPEAIWMSHEVMASAARVPVDLCNTQCIDADAGRRLSAPDLVAATQARHGVDMMSPNKHWVSVALALAAGVIGYSGHDGWGWCLFVIVLIEA